MQLVLLSCYMMNLFHCRIVDKYHLPDKVQWFIIDTLKGFKVENQLLIESPPTLFKNYGKISNHQLVLRRYGTVTSFYISCRFNKILGNFGVKHKQKLQWPIEKCPQPPTCRNKINLKPNGERLISNQKYRLMNWFSCGEIKAGKSTSSSFAWLSFCNGRTTTEQKRKS